MVDNKKLNTIIKKHTKKIESLKSEQKELLKNFYKISDENKVKELSKDLKK